jgi:hypothetical protein
MPVDWIDQDIAAGQQAHIRHAAIDVPPNKCPFHSQETEKIFQSALKDVQDVGIVPGGMGVTEAEWTDGGYGEIEPIPFGRGGRSLDVVLPFIVWWPRAVLWAQGLELMTRVCTLEG